MNVTAKFNCLANEDLLSNSNVIEAIGTMFPPGYLVKLQRGEAILLSCIIMLNTPNALGKIDIRRFKDEIGFKNSFMSGDKVMSIDTRRIISLVTDTAIEGTIILTLDNDKCDQAW